MKLFKKAKKGFTLVELIVVIAIIAVLAAVSIIGYTAFVQSAKKSNANTEGGEVKTILTSALADGTRKQVVAVNAAAPTPLTKFYYVQYSSVGITFYDSAAATTGTEDALDGTTLGSLYNYLASDTKIVISTTSTNAVVSFYASGYTASNTLASASSSTVVAVGVGTATSGVAPTATLASTATLGVFSTFTYTNISSGVASDTITL